MLRASDISTLTSLDLSEKAIFSLDGLEYAVNLTSLNLADNSIGDLAPLAPGIRKGREHQGQLGLPNLKYLALDGNPVSDLAPLAALANLEFLNVDAGAHTALSFDGVDDYVQVVSPSNLPLGNAVRTMELWFRTPVELSTNQNSSLIQYGTESVGRMFGLVASQNAPGKLYFFGYGTDLWGTTTMQPNTWYHGAVSYDGSNLKLYLNGQLEASKSDVTLATTLTSNGLTMGYRPRGDLEAHWKGEIAEVRVWNVARTPVQIKDAMYRRLAGSEEGLVGYWRFDEGSGDTAHDATANNNDGTLGSGSGPAWVASDLHFGFSDISPLANLANLHTLSLANQRIERITLADVAAWQKLVHLDLAGNGVADITALAGMQLVDDQTPDATAPKAAYRETSTAAPRWQRNLTKLDASAAFDGDYRFHAPAPAGATEATATASWTFSGLVPGSYEVLLTWPYDAQADTSYRVSDAP